MNVKSKALSKLIIFALVLLTLAAFIAVFFHHHEDGSHTPDCPICRLVQQVVCFFILAVFAFFLVIFFSRQFFCPSFQNLAGFLLTSNLEGRAPPFLF